MKSKVDLDTTVALLLNKEHAEVSLITSAFVTELMNSLVSESAVNIRGFGRFLLKEEARKPQVSNMPILRKGKIIGHCTGLLVRSYRVSFKKSHVFKAKIYRRKGKGNMEKLGVDEGCDQEALEKLAAQGCPECGRKPERHGNILICPEHGSAPFEVERKSARK